MGEKAYQTLDVGQRFDASKMPAIPFQPKYRFMETTASNTYTVYDKNGRKRLKYMYKGLEYDAVGVRGITDSSDNALQSGLVYLIS